jgi:hypothetical protein
MKDFISSQNINGMDDITADDLYIISYDPLNNSTDNDINNLENTQSVVDAR